MKAYNETAPTNSSPSPSSMVEQLKKYYENLPDAVVLCDKNMQIIWKNEQAKEMLEQELKELFSFSSDKQAQLLESISKNGQYITLSYFGMTSFRILIRATDSGEFFAEIFRQESIHPYYLEKKEERLLTNFSMNARKMLENIFSVLPMIGNKIDEKEDAEASALMRGINGHCLNMLKFVNTYSDYEKLVASEEKGEQQMNVSKELEIMCASVSMKAYRERIKFTYEIPQENIMCQISENEFRRAILHLIANAMRFAGPDNEVNLKAYRQDNRVMICISDHGAGMPAQNFDQIFDPFYSLDPETQTFAGLGIGLPYLKQFLLKYKGTQVINSQPNAGTKVLISLPIAEHPNFCSLCGKPSKEYDEIDSFSIVQVYLADILQRGEN